MTNGWIDIKNTDMMLVMGGNPAENHPCGFKWAIEAKRTRNAKMIVVDPRFTRTAATSDLFLQIRAGADIAFLGGVIRYAHRKQPHRQRISRQLHQRRFHREGRLQAAGRRAVLRFRRRLADLRPVLVDIRVWQRHGWRYRRTSCRARPGGTCCGNRRACRPTPRGIGKAAARTAAEGGLRPHACSIPAAYFSC